MSNQFINPHIRASVNSTNTFTPGGVNFINYWSKITAHIDIGTIVEVKTLGQTITDSDLRQQLKDETQIDVEEIPIYACDVICEGTSTRWDNCQILYPWVHGTAALQGAGIYFVPEEGARVIVMTSVGGQPFIIGFLGSVDQDEAGYRNKKEALTKGSICLKAGSENKIILRKGGVILVQSTPACLRRYIPLRDQIRDLCQNYFLTTEGGGIEWVKDPGSGLYTNWRHIFFDHPKNLPPTPASGEQEATNVNSVIIDVGQDKDVDKQGRSIYNLKVQDQDEIMQFLLNVRPNGYCRIYSRDVRDVTDLDYGLESGCIDIDAEYDLDLTAMNRLRLGSTIAGPKASPPVPSSYPKQVRDGTYADFDPGQCTGAAEAEQQTTDYVDVTCEEDHNTNVGNDHVELIGNDWDKVVLNEHSRVVKANEGHVCEADRGDRVKGEEKFIVDGQHIMTGNVLHLNPSAFGAMPAFQTVAGAGKIVMDTVADGAFNFADQFEGIMPEVNHLQNMSPVDVGGLLSGALTNLNIPFQGGFTSTLNSVIGTTIGVDTVLGGATTFSLDNLNGTLALVEGIDFVQTAKGAIDLTNSPAIQAFLDDGFGSPLVTDFLADTLQFDVFNGNGLAGGLIDGTEGILDIDGLNNIITDTGQLLSPIVSDGIFAYHDLSSSVVRDLDLTGSRALQLWMSGPSNDPYNDPVTGDLIAEERYTYAEGFVVT